MTTYNLLAGAAGAAGQVILIPDVHVLCDTPILLRGPESVPEAIAQAWADNTIAQIDDKFIPGWQLVLDTFDTYKSLLVDPATAGYPAFLRPGRVSRRGHSTALSLALHQTRLEAAYERFVASIDFLTGAGRDAFELKLQASRDAYREGARYPMALTGCYLSTILGAATRQWFFLGTSPKFDFYRWPTDWVEGDYPPDPPFLVDGNTWDQARRHQNLLVQGGVHMLQGLPIPKVHDALDAWLTENLQADYLPPPDSTIRFLAVDGVLTIRTMIALAT